MAFRPVSIMRTCALLTVLVGGALIATSPAQAYCVGAGTSGSNTINPDISTCSGSETFWGHEWSCADAKAGAQMRVCNVKMNVCAFTIKTDPNGRETYHPLACYFQHDGLHQICLGESAEPTGRGECLFADEEVVRQVVPPADGGPVSGVDVEGTEYYVKHIDKLRRNVGDQVPGCEKLAGAVCSGNPPEYRLVPIIDFQKICVKSEAAGPGACTDDFPLDRRIM